MLEDLVDQDQNEKYVQLKSDLSKVKLEVKDLEHELIRKEKELKKLHEEYISKEEKIKEINLKLKIKQNNPPKVEITQQMIDELKQKLETIRVEREQVEEKGFKEIEDAEQ